MRAQGARLTTEIHENKIRICMEVYHEFDSIVENVHKEYIPDKKTSFCCFRTVFYAIKAILASFGVLVTASFGVLGYSPSS